MELITRLASPAEHRQAAARAAASYSRLVAAVLPDPVLSTAVQHAADTHRVIAALWGKAAASPDPGGAFFRLASTATAAATSVPGPSGGARAGALVAASRREWAAALAEMNVPLVFPASVIPATLGAPDWAGGRARHLHNMAVVDYVAARRAQARELSGVPALLAGLDAYLVDAATAVGDHALVNAHARWALALQLTQVSMSAEDARDVIADVLGAVEMVRATAYLPLR